MELSRQGRPGSARRVVAFIAMAVFALQSFIAQTHIHGSSQATGGIVRLATPHLPAQSKLPVDNNQADCPFCQAVTHVGAALGSPTPLLILPFAWVETAALIFAPRADSTSAAHDWKSRAPPRS
jgi:hypothetical protein